MKIFKFPKTCHNIKFIFKLKKNTENSIGKESQLNLNVKFWKLYEDDDEVMDAEK
jgi:hypothetical protein